MSRTLLVFGALLAMLCASPAQARENRGDRPWKRGTLMPAIGFGAGFQSNLTQLSISIGASYFVANGFALGLGVSDTVFIFSQDFRATYPGIEDQVTTNMVRVMPSLRYIPWRNRRFSPYVFASAGPVFLNHGGGTVGEWNAGPGAYIGVGGPVYIDVGVGFSARFPRETCDSAFYYNGPDAAGQVINACSFRWGPRIGLVLAFGGSRAGAPKRSRRPEQTPPPQQTWEEPAPAPAPEYADEAAPEVEQPLAPEYEPEPEVERPLAPEYEPTTAPLQEPPAEPDPNVEPGAELDPESEVETTVDVTTEPAAETQIVTPPASSP